MALRQSDLPHIVQQRGGPQRAKIRVAREEAPPDLRREGRHTARVSSQGGLAPLDHGQQRIHDDQCRFYVALPGVTLVAIAHFTRSSQVVAQMLNTHVCWSAQDGCRRCCRCDVTHSPRLRVEQMPRCWYFDSVTTGRPSRAARRRAAPRARLGELAGLLAGIRVPDPVRCGARGAVMLVANDYGLCDQVAPSQGFSRG